MKVADYLIDYLGDYGIDQIFILYGAANGHLIDAFTRTKKTKYVAVLHEQAGGFAAEGYAKIKGKPGVSIVTSGPGALNLLTPIANCFYDSVPCVFITGQINSKFLRPSPEIRQVGFQETDIVSIVRPITKYATMIRRPEDIRSEIEKALFLCQHRRPGPVLLDIPVDVQEARIDPTKLVGFDPTPVQGSYDFKAVDLQIDRYLEDLRKAKRPIILLGGGVHSAGAVEEVRTLGKTLKIPCFATWNAMDVVTSDYEYYGGRVGTYGGPGRNFGVQNSDLLLAIGSRISGRITGGNVRSFARGAKKYLVDVDEAQLTPALQQLPFDENILCDARDFTTRLIAKAKSAPPLPSFADWTSQVMTWKTKYDPVQPAFMEKRGYVYEGKPYVHPYAFMRKLSRQMASDGIVVGDLGGVSVVCGHGYKARQAQRFVTNNGNAPMGFSFAGAIGCWFADPRRQVVCVIGDGGFNMNIQELQTLINYKVGIKTFILNNHIYGITKAFQETNFQGRTEACGPLGYSPPDFVKVSDAYGVKTFTISDNSEIEAKIAEVLAYDGPVVCDVNMHEFHAYEPRIFGWGTPIEDMYPYLPRDEFRANMMIEPHDTWQKPVYPDVVKPQSSME